MKFFKSTILAFTFVFALDAVQSVFAQACGYESYNNPACQGQAAYQREQNAANNQAAANAEAQRQWQIREDRVLARIAKYRATAYYGAIAVSNVDGSMGWGGGYKTVAKSSTKALGACSGGDCQVIATFSNACAGIAQKYGSKDSRTLVIATGSNEEIALNKAADQCEAKYGKGNCGMLNNSKALCVGYDYGQYDK